MTASETLKLIAKQWCNLNDLMKLAGVGRNNALVIKSTIKKKLESENYYVPNNAVPMQEVVKYLNIDIPYLFCNLYNSICSLYRECKKLCVKLPIHGNKDI